MKKPEKIKKGLECCKVGISWATTCAKGCPYLNEPVPGGRCEMALLKDALALIQLLESQVPRWIPVEERLPKQLQYVLAINQYDDDSFEPCIAYFRAGLWFHGNFMGGEITHWMPLPTLPEAPKDDAHE